MLPVAFAVFVLQSAAPAASAPPAAAPLPTLTQARLYWRRKLDPFQLVKHYPAAARKAGIRSAWVDLDCVADTYGAPVCQAVAESAPGYGFGPIAVMLMAKTKVDGFDGESPEGRRFGYRLRFGEGAPGV